MAIVRAEQITKDNMIFLPLNSHITWRKHFSPPDKNLAKNSGYNMSPYYLYIMPNTIVVWGYVHSGPNHPLWQADFCLDLDLLLQFVGYLKIKLLSCLNKGGSNRCCILLSDPFDTFSAFIATDFFFLDLCEFSTYFLIFRRGFFNWLHDQNLSGLQIIFMPAFDSCHMYIETHIPRRRITP